MDPRYVESVWWSLKQIFEAGLLVQDHRVTPYCPRCGTGLSDHEVAQGYLDVTDPSVYVRFPVTSGPLAERGAALLVWTTTPWTLISNTAVAVNPAVTYVVARPAGSEELLVVAEPLLDSALGEGAEVLERIAGQRRSSTRPTPGRSTSSTSRARISSGSPTTSPSRTAPAWCTRRRRSAPTTCRRPALRAAGRQPGRARTATSSPTCRWSAASSSRPPTPPSSPTCRARPAAPVRSDYLHSYPHCWRCDTALIYYALPSWYIRTTARKDAAAPGERRAPTGTRPRSRPAGTATGSRTTSTGRCRATATGARRCRSGAARTTT